MKLINVECIIKNRNRSELTLSLHCLTVSTEPDVGQVVAGGAAGALYSRLSE